MKQITLNTVDGIVTFFINPNSNLRVTMGNTENHCYLSDRIDEKGLCINMNYHKLLDELRYIVK